jgi:hypothetical protein
VTIEVELIRGEWNVVVRGPENSFHVLEQIFVGHTLRCETYFDVGDLEEARLKCHELREIFDRDAQRVIAGVQGPGLPD